MLPDFMPKKKSPKCLQIRGGRCLRKRKGPCIKETKVRSSGFNSAQETTRQNQIISIPMMNKYLCPPPIVRLGLICQKGLKITTWYHFLILRMASTKKTKSKRGCRAKGALMHWCLGNENWCSHYRKQFGSSSKH